jgi:ribosomal protein L37AE/L43A
MIKWINKFFTKPKPCDHNWRMRYANGIPYWHCNRCGEKVID